MRQPVVRIWMAEVFRIVRDKSEPSAGRCFCRNHVRINFNQYGIIGPVSVPMEWSAFVYAALRRTCLHHIGDFGYRRGRE